MAKKRIDNDSIEIGTSNVFEDLGFPDAEDLSVKVLLAMEINRTLDARSWTQSYVAKVFGVSQPHVSELRNFKLRHFSTDRLLGFLRRLNVDVKIVLSHNERRQGRSGSMSVVREVA